MLINEQKNERCRGRMDCWKFKCRAEQDGDGFVYVRSVDRTKNDRSMVQVGD